MSVKELLKRARQVVQNGWTQGAFARDSAGRAVPYDSPSAECFCTLGALRVSINTPTPDGFGDVRNPEYRAATAAIRDAVRIGTIPGWNDSSSTTKADVLCAFDKAIEASK